MGKIKRIKILAMIPLGLFIIAYLFFASDGMADGDFFWWAGYLVGPAAIILVFMAGGWKNPRPVGISLIILAVLVIIFTSKDSRNIWLLLTFFFSFLASGLLLLASQHRGYR